MTVTFTAPDEFAAATGANVNSNAGGPNTSTFDCPPIGAADLVISSHAGDTDP